MPTRAIDPIDLEIIQNSLQAVADEMFAVMRTTAMSSVIYEVLDMGTAVLDRHGYIVTSGAGIPGLIEMLDKAVQVIVAKFNKPGAIRDGDVFATNDPYHGGVSHLNDIIVAMPVFIGDELVGWAANVAHNADVGGMAPSSLSADATQIYQEGLRLPAIKLIDRGEPIEAVFDILTTNSRLPDYIRGDVWAAIAAARIGARRTMELAQKFGTELFTASLAALLDEGEAIAKKALAALPKGTFKMTEEQDNGTFFNLAITISDDSFIVDLRDNPDQDPGPTNLPRDGTVGMAQTLFRSMTDVDAPGNDGIYRVLKVLTREGSIFHAKEPSPVSFYFETGVRLGDLMARCMAPLAPHVFGAGSYASVCGTFIGGRHPDTGRPFTIVEPEIGGWGANRDGDGNPAMFNGGGDTFNCPAEISESRNGLYVDRMELNDGPGGEGKFRGGRGIRMDYRIRSDDSFVTASYTRHRILPWSLEGGREGSPNYIEIIRNDGSRSTHATVSNLRVDTGDVIRVVTGNGGGYGNPAERSRAAIAGDIRNGFISAADAADIYGYHP